MVLPSQGAQAKPGVTRELRKSSWPTWTDGLPCEQGGFSFEWPAFNIYEVVRAVCQSRLTDKRRERLPNTLKAMQKRNLSAGKVEWAGFLNEVLSVSIRPSPIFFFFFFFIIFFYTIEEAPHYHAPLVSGVPLKEAVSVKAVRCIRGRKEFALKLCPVSHLSS